MPSPKFQIEILAPNRKVFSGEVQYAILPGAEGEFGVLAGHANLFSVLGIGEIRLDLGGGKSEFLAVSGGYAEVRGNGISIVAEAAEKASEIDVNQAMREQESALEKLDKAKEKWEMEDAKIRLRIASARIRTAQRLKEEKAA